MLLLLMALACNKDTADTSAGSYHPQGWAAPSDHGQAAKMNDDTCTNCHGAELQGVDEALSCDTCHSAGWREDCTYCHGDQDSIAPPQSFDDSLTSPRFAAHSVHLSSGGDNGHPAYDCNTCHVVPDTLLQDGHIFDSTPGRADVDLSAGLSNQGTYDLSLGCDNLYCHGNGRSDNGSISIDADSRSCTSCHTKSLGGEHGEHRRGTITCESCHADVVSGNTSVHDPELHVNGAVELAFTEPAMERGSDERCTGACHGERHNSARW